MVNKKILFGFSIFLVLAVVVSFGAGILTGRSTVEPKTIFGVLNPEEGKPNEVDFSLFWDAWAKLQENFVDKSAFDYQEMLYGAISGMTKSLGDPYTIFLSPEEAKQFTEDVNGTFEGIGAEIGIRKGELLIIAPLEGAPAQKAGLRAGDKILKIDDTITSDLTVDEAVNLIRGPKGTEVTLTIFRENSDHPEEIKIKRAAIEVPSLKWELKENNIAYLKLYQFSGNAQYDFRDAVFEIIKSPAKKLILDLRDNTGGYLEVSNDIASWFLEKGQVVVIEDFGNGKQEKYYSRGYAVLSDFPTVVLTNQGTASAAEILAGALRDNRNIKLIGETSFGKGSVQELKDLKDGSYLKITVAKWLTPKGTVLTDKGLEPDIKVEMTNEDYDNNRDPQLDKAIEIIKGL